MWERPSPRKVLLTVLLTQSAIVLGLLLYLAFTDKALVLDFAARDELGAPPAATGLIIPVAGVQASELRNTYGAPRSGGRTHEGIDIFAPDGTPVLAAATGVLVGRDSSALGGLAVYLRGLDHRTIYFYGHLQRFAAGLKEGDLVRQGDVLAYVGQTGNVPPGSPHLHFSIHIVSDPNQWWRGRSIDPCDHLPCGSDDAPDA